MYTYTPLLTALLPTLSDYMSSIRLADAERQQERDVRPLMSILKRVSTADTRVAGHCLTRKTAVSAFDFVIEGMKDDELRGIKGLINKVLSLAVDAALFGCAGIAVDYQSGKVIKTYKPYELEKEGERAYILADSGDTFKRVEPAELTDIIVLSESEERGGVLRSVAPLCLLKNDTIKEWANFNRKLKGLIQAVADDDEKADVAKAIQEFVLNQAAITSPNASFQFHSMTDSKGSVSFEVFKQALDADIAIGILGQANTAELPSRGGSRAALQIMNLIRADIHYSDMSRAEELINSTFLLNYYKVNYNKNATSHPWSFSFIYDENEDVEVNGRVISEAIQNGIPLIAEEVYRKLNMTMPQASDKLLTVDRNEF